MQNDIENILNEIASKEFERKDGLFSLCGYETVREGRVYQKKNS